MGKKEENQPPSLFDNLDMFAVAPANGAPAAKPVESEEPKAAESRRKQPKADAGKQQQSPALPPTGLTGTGPMQALYDFNFRQYSAYVICSRAIPAVEDGLKPVQRRIMHSLWEKDDGRYTKVANIVGHAM